MVCNQDDSIWEPAFNPAIWRHSQLPSYRGIATNPYDSRRPPLCHCSNQDSKGLLCCRHVGVEEVFVVEIERGAKELSAIYPTWSAGCPDQLLYCGTHETHEPRLYITNKRNRRSCMKPPCLTSPAGCPSTSFPPPSLFVSGCPALCLCLRVSFAIAINCL